MDFQEPFYNYESKVEFYLKTVVGSMTVEKTSRNVAEK